jgi:hypothetical protein
MALPELTDSGELPLGVHLTSLQETLARNPSCIGGRDIAACELALFGR